MFSKKDILNLINKSDISLIGYEYKSERIKDEFISNLNYIEINEINSSFCFRTFLRDLKINYLFTDQSIPEYILLDITNIYNDKIEKLLNKNLRKARKAKIRNVIMKMSEKIYTDFSTVYPQKPSFKLIITCPMYKSLNTGMDKNICTDAQFIGDNDILYMSQFAMIIIDDEISVIKNRHYN